jgi:serine/threonine protein kinase
MKPSTAAVTTPTTQTTSDTQRDVEERERVLDQVFAAWRNGEPPDALHVLEERPELRRRRSAVIELACEEYWHLTDRGESPYIVDFCGRFPGHESALRRLLSLQSEINSLTGTRVARGDWPALGTVYRGFRLQELLGCGAFSRVYLAHDTALADRLVALKITTLPGNEPAALGKLRHDNIVPVHAHYPPDRDEFSTLVMPYLGSATLEDVLERLHSHKELPTTARIFAEVSAGTRPAEQGDLPIVSPSAYDQQSCADAVLRIAQGLCQGLAEAHRLGFLHLDMKPSNVLLAFDGTPKLLDFNLTGIASGSGTLGLGGTLPYMSPEQLAAAFDHRAESAKLDARSDLFSLGVVLYELFSGVHPFGPLDPTVPSPMLAEILKERQRQGAKPLRQLNRRLNASCAALIDSCLSCTVTRRPASADVLSQRIGEELRWKPRLNRWALRKPEQAAVATILIVAMSGGIAYGWSQYPSYVERCAARAAVAYVNDRPQEVVDLATTVLDQDSTNDDVRLLRAHSRLQLNRADLAVADYLLLLSGPRFAEARSGLIYAYASKSDFAKSMAFENVPDGSPPLTAGDLNNLAYCHMQLSQREAARTLLDQAVLLDPQAIAVRYNRSITDLQRTHTLKNYRPTVGVADLEFATQQVEAGELFNFLALLYVEMGPEPDSSKRAAEAALTQAMRCGYELVHIKRNPAFKSLQLPEGIPIKNDTTLRKISRLMAPYPSVY